jgi:hypothetical protein
MNLNHDEPDYESHKCMFVALIKGESPCHLCLWLQYVMVLLKGGVPMSFGGSEEPTSYGEVVSIGGLGLGVNGKLSAVIADILDFKLSVDKSHFYIKFYDVEVH